MITCGQKLKNIRLFLCRCNWCCICFYGYRGVIDPRSGEEISFQDAVNARIIDQTHGMYVNPNTGGGMSIPEAMNEGRIKVEWWSL